MQVKLQSQNENEKLTAAPSPVSVAASAPKFHPVAGAAGSINSMNIKARWIHMDRFGSVKCAYVGNDGKLHWPTPVCGVWADMREITKRNTPGSANHFDVESCSAVYEINGERYAIEGCWSKVFKPLAVVMKSLSSRNPFLAKHNAALGKRSELTVLS